MGVAIKKINHMLKERLSTKVLGFELPVYHERACETLKFMAKELGIENIAEKYIYRY